MKAKFLKLFAVLLLFLTIFAGKASAALYQFIPSTPDIFDLDHYKYYTWGINWSPSANETIVGAVLKIKNINNWAPEDNDKLFIHLLDSAYLDLKTYQDDQGGGDNFASWPTPNILLDTYTDPDDYPGPAHDYILNFNSAQLAKLYDYSSNNGRFGFGFDPDCHYWNDGVKFKIFTTTAPVPEPASLVLLTTGLIGGIGLRRKKLSV